MNNPPITQTDETQFCLTATSRTAKVNVLINDTDPDPNDTIYLTNAKFVNITDTAFATLTVNAADSTITLIVKPSANLSTGKVFDIAYNIKDNGLPASQCATGLLKITAILSPVVSVEKTELCVNITAILSPRTDGTWVSSDPAVAEIIDNAMVKGVTPGTAKLTYTSTATGCSEDITVTVKEFPEVADITGEKVLCPNSTIELSNAASGGVWTCNNNNVTFSNTTANPVTVTGVTEGSTFVSYTVSNGACQTKRTYRLKIVSNTPPTVIIGIER
jgi:hypothetical protein